MSLLSILVVVLYANVASSLSPNLKTSNEYIFNEDRFKVKFSIAPNDDYNSFAFVHCKNFTNAMTGMNCTVIVESNIFDAAKPFARICNLTVNAGDHRRIGYYKYAVDMLDKDKVIVSHEQEVLNATDSTNTSRVLSIRVMDMNSCDSTGSDISVKFSVRMLPQPDYFIIPFQGILKIVAHSRDSPCNWTYCIFTYDETGNRIGDVVPVLPFHNIDTGLLVNLRFSTGSSYGNHVALFVNQSDQSEKLFYVEPSNETIRAMLVKDKASRSKRLFYDITSSVNGDTILVCLDSDNSIECKQLDQRFNLMTDFTLRKNYSSQILRTVGVRSQKRTSHPMYRYGVPLTRLTCELMEVKNLGNEGFLILTTNRETNRVTKIYKNGRREELSYLDTKKCFGQSRLYTEKNELCYFVLCETHNKVNSHVFGFQMSNKCAGKI